MEYILIKQPRVLPYQVFYLSAKRVMDLLICLLLLPIALPVMLICACAIYLNSPGNVFYIQDRIGRGGRPFRIYKFRTMVKSLENDAQCRSYMRRYIRGSMATEGENKKVFKPLRQDNIFRVGALLRKTSLDELPQIINVLKGEMSIVGPRPNVRWEVEAYHPWHHERLEVLPGITGLAQVHGRSCIDFNTMVRYDVEYIENRCLLLDIEILWWTLLSVIKGKGAK